MVEITPTEPLFSPEVQMLRNNRDEGYNYKYRRSLNWTEIYELYRNTVITNRLEQRQSVNIPVMKGQIRSLLKDMDDMPVIYFENLDNDKQAELFLNEYWKYTVDKNNMEEQDIVDKRQELLCGRTFDQWQIKDGRVIMTVQDPEDIKVSRYTNPFDLHSSRYLIHDNIYVPLSSLKKNTDYDQTAIAELEEYFQSQDGIIKATENEKQVVEKAQKMRDMGVPDVEDPVLGETYVELALHFVYRDNEYQKGAKEGDAPVEVPTQIFLYVLAQNMKLLMKKPLEEVIGVTVDHFWRNHYPYNSWADDLERQDFWSDSVGDIILVPNKILNAWFSQLVENRTLRNFGMHYYNSRIEGFTPQTMQPIPWGWYGIPVPDNGSIDAVIKKVDVPDLSESLDEMVFLVGVMEKATGATSGQQGVPSERKITLGEFQATLTEAKERVKGMSKFYTPAWKRRGEMFLKLIEAAPDKIEAVKLFKKGRNSNEVYAREVAPKDWITKLGYRTKVWSQDEKDLNDVNTLQKQSAVKQAMPNNHKVQEIYQRKLLEWANYTPDEINEIMQMEEEQRQQMIEAAQAAMMMGGGVPGATPTPVNPPAQLQPLPANGATA